MLNVFAEGVNKCSPLFEDSKAEARAPRIENGHNVSLRNVMLRMKDMETSIREFVDGLTPRPQSRFLADNSTKYRNQDALIEIIKLSKQYEKILSHLVEHSDHMMMSARIQTMPPDKRAQFAAMYKVAYVKYFETFQTLTLELESLKNIDPKNWDNHRAQEILMDLHNQMGAAHNRF